MAYGLTTYKADGTIILQNSTKSGVFGEVLTVPKTTAGAVTYVNFPQYAGRTLRPIQLMSGAHRWDAPTYTNGIPQIKFTQLSDIYSIPTNLPYYYDSTILYIFVK